MINKMAISATIHCLIGCSIGEVTGMIIGTHLGMSNGATVALSITLAFISGYILSILPIVRAGVPLKKAARVVIAADTVSILVMEIVDNGVMLVIPGAMGAGLLNPVFWVSMVIALGVAFLAAVPVNRYLLLKGKGHALVHEYHHGKHDHASHGDEQAHHEHHHDHHNH